MLASVATLFLLGFLLVHPSIVHRALAFDNGLDEPTVSERLDFMECEDSATKKCAKRLNVISSSPANLSYEFLPDNNNNANENNIRNDSFFRDFDDIFVENTTTKNFINELDILTTSEMSESNSELANGTNTIIFEILNNARSHNSTPETITNIKKIKDEKQFDIIFDSKSLIRGNSSDHIHRINSSETPTMMIFANADESSIKNNSAIVTLPMDNFDAIDIVLKGTTEKSPTLLNISTQSQPENENLKKSSRRHHHHHKNRKHKKDNKIANNLKFKSLSTTTPLMSSSTTLQKPTDIAEIVHATTTSVSTAKPAIEFNSNDFTYQFYRNESNRKKSGYYAKSKKTPKYQLADEQHYQTTENYSDKANDKNMKGKYIYDAKYNFPESKFTGNNVFKSSENYFDGDNHFQSDITTKSMRKSATNIILEPSDQLESAVNKNSMITSKNANDNNSENNLDLLLKYLTKPKPPKGTIMWKAINAPIPLAYFTITVISGQLSRRRRPPPPNKRRVPNARIYLTGLNMPTGYTQITEGSQIKGSNAALVRTLNPQTTGPFVEFKIRVENKYGSTCKQMCLDASQRYRRCARKIVRLSTYKKFSDPIPFHETSGDAIDGQWTGRGYYRRRKYDYLLFRCD